MEYEKLRQLIDHHIQLSFPAHPYNDKLAEWILDLSEFDAYYLGIANFFLNKKKLQQLDFSDFDEMNIRLRAIVLDSDKDKSIFDSCVKYMDSIHAIISEINFISKSK
jgi:hypothetical protein